MKIISLAPEDESLLRAITVHEAGHAVVAQCFGLEPKAFIAGPWAAAVRYTDPLSRFPVASISWAGALAEDLVLARCPKRTLPGLVLSRDTIHRWITAMLCEGGLAQLSVSDQSGINSCRSSQIETAVCAFDLLDARRDLLEWRAAKLADEARPNFMAALIRNDTGADRADLMNLVVR